jgi:hypothetical protein
MPVEMGTLLETRNVPVALMPPPDMIEASHPSSSHEDGRSPLIISKEIIGV